MTYRTLAIRALLAAIIPAAALALASCTGTTYEYSNPLDPKEDAPVSSVVTGIPDANLQQAILDQYAGSTKFQVQEIYADGYGVTSVAGIEFFPRVSTLWLGNNPLNGVDLSPIVRLPDLQELHLNGVVDPDIQSLAGSSVRILALRDANIIYPDLQTIAGLPNIRDLALSGPGSGSGAYYTVQGTNVFDDLATAGLAGKLTDAIHIEYFNIASSADLIGIEAFVGTSQIDLAFNQINDPGLLQPFFNASAIDSQQADHDLSLYGNPLSAGLLPNIGGYIDQLEGLSLGGTGITSLTPGELPGSTTLIRLDLNDNSALSDISAVGNFPNLEELLISRTDADETTLFSAGLPNLRLLAANAVGDGGASPITTVAGISAFSALEYVFLDNNLSLTGGIAELAQLPNLQSVSFSGSTNVSTADIQAIIDANPDVFVTYPDGTVYAP